MIRLKKWRLQLLASKYLLSRETLRQLEYSSLNIKKNTRVIKGVIDVTKHRFFELISLKA